MSTSDLFGSPPPSPDGGTVAISIVSSLVALAIIGAISCFCAKKLRKGIVNELRTVVATPAANAFPTTAMVVQAPTMERFLEANRKPVRFTAQQLCAFTSNYSTRLGAGGFGVVYEGQFPDGLKIAVKDLKRSIDRTAEEQFMAEVGTLGRTFHLNVVKLHGFCYDHYMSALVYEYMENGSLDRYLFSKDRAIGWNKLREIAIGTAKGLAYLHKDCGRTIIHYDIKPANILLDADFLAKVADFGLARLCGKDITHDSVTAYRGTPGYSAPEFMLKNFPITHKCDVYSFGMVLFEIVGRRRNAIVDSSSESINWFPKHVWEEYEKGELTTLIVDSGITEEKDRQQAETVAKVALWCVQDSPDDRPPMSAVVKMLEGGVEIVPPPKPFHYLFNIKAVPPSEHDTTSLLQLQETSNSQWYSDSLTTPNMKKYEIQVATS